LVRGGSGVKSTAEILEVMRDVGRRRGDLYEVAVFEDSINVRGRRSSSPTQFTRKLW